MRKLLIAGLMTSAVAVAAHAGSISFDSRADYEAKNYNDASNTRNYNKMYMQTLRLDAKGNFDEATSYRLRVRFNKTATAMRTADSLNDSTDFAFIQHKVMDNLSFQLGKLGTEIGGFEGMTAGSDLYFLSQAYGEQTALRYATGAKIIYTVAGQELNFMTVNQQTDPASANASSTAVNFDQTHNAMGLVYKGSFMDKALLPYVSYFMDDVQAVGTASSATPAVLTKGTDKKYNYMTVGIKWDAKPVFVEADYSMNNYKNKSVMDETDTTNSIVATVGYQLDNWVAKLKYEGSEVKTFTAANTSTKATLTGMQLAAEYMPSGDKNFRYHVAYMTRDTKPETGDTQTSQTVIAGFKLYADFLK